MRKNKEETRIYNKRYYQIHRQELLNKAVIQGAIYRRAHSEKELARATRYRQTHRKENRAYQVAYYQKYRKKLLAKSAIYRCTPNGKAAAARGHAKWQSLKRQQTELAAERALTNAQWNTIAQLQREKCYWCGRKRKLTIDHVIPLSKGGMHIAENIVAACMICNVKKQAKILTLF